MSELLAKPEASDVELAPTTWPREVVIPGVPANLKAGRVSDWMMFGVLCPPWPAAGKTARLPGGRHKKGAGSCGDAEASNFPHPFMSAWPFVFYSGRANSFSAKKLCKES